MANFTIKDTRIETIYKANTNYWYAKVYNNDGCIHCLRRLREGVYPFYNGIVASVDYNKKDRESQPIDGATIEFKEPCLIESSGDFSPCDNC